METYDTEDWEQRGNQGEVEEPVEIPVERINPDTLRMMIEEFVTREWNDTAESELTLDQKVQQVLLQLKANRARITFDAASESWNIISCQGNHP